MRAISIAFLTVSLLASVADAQLSSDYVDWAEGPVRHLMTVEDLETWKLLDSDKEAQAFIELFWARRDPTPATPENEWRAEFETRASLADQHFSTSKQTGSMTDRGRVLILLGSPTEVASRGAEMRSRDTISPDPGGPWTDGQVALPSTTAQPARQIWTYGGEKKPAFVHGKVLELMFTDDAGRNDWQLATTERVNPSLVLQQAVSALIFSPDLTKAPTFGRATTPPDFEDVSLRSAYELAMAQPVRSVGPGHLTYGEFVTTDGRSFEAIQLYFPADSGLAAGRPVTLVGVVENESGQIVDLHVRPVTLTASVGNTFVDDSFVLKPGRYTTSLGIAEDGQLVAIKAVDIIVAGLDPAKAGISDLILSNHAYALPEAQTPTDPYAFGGMKFVPKGDSLFSTTDDLWYFFELRNPGLSEAGTPKMNVKVNFDGKAAGSGEAVRFELPFREVETIKLKGLDGRYGLGMSFPLKDFKPGQYTVKIRVIDTVLRASYDFERALEVR